MRECLGGFLREVSYETRAVPALGPAAPRVQVEKQRVGEGGQGVSWRPSLLLPISVLPFPLPSRVFHFYSLCPHLSSALVQLRTRTSLPDCGTPRLHRALGTEGVLRTCFLGRLP